MKEPMGKDENCVIASTAELLCQAMNEAKRPELVLLRFVRGVMQSHRSWGSYALGRGTCLAFLKQEARTCRVCGCTESDACLVPMTQAVLAGEMSTIRTLVPCSWVAEDLCSACVEIDRQLNEERERDARSR